MTGGAAIAQDYRGSQMLSIRKIQGRLLTLRSILLTLKSQNIFLSKIELLFK